ncbi:hypothetical protein [Hoeflea sp.]|uniref:hypothetical protein n=1 Tax=Hoeflea sp. TaxID=1940281 RepID=UPI003A8E5729
MADQIELLDDGEGAFRIGMKVIEMADRLKPVQSVCPGAVASWAFEIDEVRFKVTVAVDQAPAL